MSVRALALGLLAAMLVVTLQLVSRLILHIPFEFNTHLPLGVYAMVMVLILGINPLLWRLRRTWRLTARELVIILAMALSAVHVAGVGFMTVVPQLLVMPLQLIQVNEGWRRHALMEYVPPAMLVNDAQTTGNAGEVASRFIVGRGGSGPNIGLSQVPWDAWSTTLSFWLPVIVLMGIASIAMALIVHRQWSVNERLRYPLADFAASLIEQQPGRLLGPVYRSRMFWIGLVIVFGFRVIGQLVRFVPSLAIIRVPLPMQFDFSAVTNRWPDLEKAYVDLFIKTPTIWPTAAAFAYLLATDVGLSLWSSHAVYGAVKLILMAWGFQTGTNFILGGWDASTRFGAFIGVAIILFYTGRRYYGQVIRRAFGGQGGETDAWTGWAFWGVVLPAGLVVMLLIGQGLDWPLSIASVVLLLILYLVTSRMSAEAGLYVIRAGWMPISVFWGLMGGHALGLEDLFIVGLLSMVLCLDTVECMMPYVVNSLRVADVVGVKISRVGKSMSLGLVVALGLAVVLCLWAYYNFGAPTDGWTLTNLPGRAFLAPYRTATTLSLAGLTQQVAAYSPLERLENMNPDPRFLPWTAIGLVSVLLLGMLRLRLPWWPLHPIFVLVWGSWTAGVYSVSILAGWLIKIVVIRLGGVKLYRTVKPLMIGVIAADALGALLQMAIGLIYYQVTGLPFAGAPT